MPEQKMNTSRRKHPFQTTTQSTKTAGIYMLIIHRWGSRALSHKQTGEWTITEMATPSRSNQNSVGHEKWSSPEVIQKSTLALRKEMNWRDDPICTGIPLAKGHILFENILCRPATIVEATGDVVNICPCR